MSGTVSIPYSNEFMYCKYWLFTRKYIRNTNIYMKYIRKLFSSKSNSQWPLNASVQKKTYISPRKRRTKNIKMKLDVASFYLRINGFMSLGILTYWQTGLLNDRNGYVVKKKLTVREMIVKGMVLEWLCPS